MTTVSRRALFLRGPVAALAATITPQALPPQQAWIITEPNWEYNDEFTSADGETTLPMVFFDQSAAEAECRRLNEAFYAAQTPEDFELDWAEYFPDGLSDGQSEASITWDQVKRAGWIDPYVIHRLTTPGAFAHE